MPGTVLGPLKIKIFNLHKNPIRAGTILKIHFTCEKTETQKD